MYREFSTSGRFIWIVLTLAGAGLWGSVVSAQDVSPEPIITFTPVEQNPVINRTEGEGWGCETGTIFAPQAIQHGDLYYLFYTGSCQRSGKPAAIGYATSPDGFTWTKNVENPILTPDGAGYDAMCVSMGVPFIDGDQWVLFYAANSTPCDGPGLHIGRATAPGPDGPWTRDSEPILKAGEPGAWDEGFIAPHAVIRTSEGYVLYYSGGKEFLIPLPRLVGMATSPDGIHWTKHDDPATTAPAFSQSDPILDLQDAGDPIYLAAWALDVDRTERGWEMFFATICPESVDPNCSAFIGYGVSDDGIRWHTYRSAGQAVLTRAQVDAEWASYCVCQPSFIAAGNNYQLYFTGCTRNLNDCVIGMATGTITWKQP